MRVLFLLFFLVIFAPPAMAAETYICPMHPHITGEHDDNCPICGMALEPKADHDADDTEHEAEVSDAFQISPAYVQALGVRTADVAHHAFGRQIRAFGALAASTRLQQEFNVRTHGWIVDLHTDAVGDQVQKGDLLFTYYSPDLMAAQSDVLNTRRVGNPEQRLRLYGMGGKAMAQLRQQGSFLEATPFYAPIDGTVTELSVRKGSYVEQGGPILTLQDFSRLWVNVAVPLRDAQFLSVGTPARISVPETGNDYASEIDFIHPVNDPESRTTTIRLILDNPDGTLKPDTYVDAVFEAAVEHRLAVPAEAVLYDSAGAYVIEALGEGHFRPVMIETGLTSQGLTEVTRGLNHGLQIVTSGQFLLDSESNLRGGMAAMGHDHGGESMPQNDTAIEEDMQEGHGQHDQH